MSDAVKTAPSSSSKLFGDVASPETSSKGIPSIDEAETSTPEAGETGATTEGTPVMGEPAETQPVESEPKTPTLPDKYSGKTLEDVIKMHQEAEKAMHLKGQEYSDIKKQLDAISAVFQQQQQQAQQAQQQQPKQPKYYHEYDPETQRQILQQFNSAYEADPIGTTFAMWRDIPQLIDTRVKEYLESQDFDKTLFPRYVSYQNHRDKFYNDMYHEAKEFEKSHPEIEHYKPEMEKIIAQWASNGLAQDMINRGNKFQDILGLAYSKVLQEKLPEERAKIEKAIRDNIAAEAQQKKTGFQVSQTAESKVPSNKLDPADLALGLDKPHKRNLFGF